MIDLTKPLQTRDGRPVRLLCADAKGPAPLVGLIDQQSGEYPERWHLSGRIWIIPADPNSYWDGAYRNMDLVNCDGQDGKA